MSLEMKYFVLKPRAKSKKDPFAKASQEAMSAYASSIEDTDPVFARELNNWVLNEIVLQNKK